jgi:hypothetical protein
VSSFDPDDIPKETYGGTFFVDEWNKNKEKVKVRGKGRGKG